MSHEKAKSIILEGNGTHFDPDIVAAFVSCEKYFAEVSDLYNSDLPRKELSRTSDAPKPIDIADFVGAMRQQSDASLTPA